MQARNFSSLLSLRAKICTLQALHVMQASCFLLTVNRAFPLLHTGQTPWPIRFSFATVRPYLLSASMASAMAPANTVTDPRGSAS